MYKLKVRAEFEAAHRLSGYEGKCSRLHGHSWLVEAEVEGERLNSLGLLVDFKDLRLALKNTLDQWDHQYLNELPDFAGVNPSAENMARLVFNGLAAAPLFKEGVRLAAVNVWESPHSCATYTAD